MNVLQGLIASLYESSDATSGPSRLDQQPRVRLAFSFNNAVQSLLSLALHPVAPLM